MPKKGALVLCFFAVTACGNDGVAASSTVDVVTTAAPVTTEPETSSTTAEQGTPTTSTLAIPESSQWAVVPDHAVVGRVFPVVVWTGSEIVVWGGEKPSEVDWHADGAAYNPNTRTWRDLADSPLAPRSEHVAVWTGTEVLICCGRVVGAGAAAAAYDPMSDQWRQMATPPINSAFAEAVWTGTEMLVFGGVGGGGTASLVGAAAYDPASDSWRRLADLPYGLEREADAVLGDGVVFVWPAYIHFTVEEQDHPPLVYDLEADEWRQLPVPPDGAPSTPNLLWTGDMVFAFGLVYTDTGVTGSSVTFDPATQTWSVASAPPLEPVPPSEGAEGSQEATWNGDEVMIWTGWVGSSWDDPATRVLAYDPGRDTWRDLDPAPIPGQGLWHEPIIWTGSRLIAYTDPMLVYTPD